MVEEPQIYFSTRLKKSVFNALSTLNFNSSIIQIKFNHMKALIIYIPENRFNTLKQILYQKKVEGISYFNIMGQGELERKFRERMKEGYKTQEKFVPAFAPRLRIETIVPEEKVKEIIDAIKLNGTFLGKIFVFDVLESYDI